jgi:hypothetical protein
VSARAAALWSVVALVGSPARAQGRPPEPLAPSRPDALAPSKIDLPQLDRALARATARRNIGIGLGIPGIALTVLGGVLIGYGAVDPNLGSGGVEIGAGVVAAVSGLLLGVPGVVLWVMNQEDMDLYRWRKARLRVSGARISW